MKILLIRPDNLGNINSRLPDSLNRRQGVLPPLGIAYIAAALEKAGNQVKVLDLIALNLSPKQLYLEIKKFQPLLTGIGAMTSTLPGALRAARAAKAAGSSTVLGGPQLAVYPEETLSYPYLDYGVNGEAEETMVQLSRALQDKLSVDGIKGLLYKKEGKLRVNDAAIIEDIDSLAFPAYHLLPMELYDSIIGRYPVSTMVSTRGCPYACHFCFKQPADARFRLRRPESVVDEMQLLQEKYKIKHIMFYDDVMTCRRSHVQGICEELLRRNLKVSWEAPSRVDDVDGSLLKLMHKAGCVRLRYGVESADEGILKLMNKNIELARVKDIFKLTRDAGIQTFAYFMIGYAHETDKTMNKTLDFALSLDPDWAMFTVATPYPGTGLYRLALKEGLIKDDYWREFSLGKKTERLPFFVPGSGKKIKQAYLRFYLRPRFVINNLRFLRSPQAWKKCWSGMEGIFTMHNN